MMATTAESPGPGEDHWDNAGQGTHGNTSAEAPSSTRAADRFAADSDRNTNESTPPMMDDDHYWEPFPDTLTAADLSKILSVGRPAVLARLKSGVIPGHLIGGSWVIFKAEVRAWLNANSNQAPAGPPADVDVLADYADELSYRDLMVIMGKTKRTIYSWLNDGEIPGFHVGNRWIIHKTQLREKLRQTSNQTFSEEK
jgi:excisionase family DNA binding protein